MRGLAGDLLRLARDWPAVWALARQTVIESIRRKIFVVLVLFCLALLASAFMLPVIDEGEHRLKLVQSFAFGGTTLFGILIAAFVAAAILPEDIAERRVFSVLAAPVARSHYLLGRFLGVAMVLGLLVTGVCLITVLVLPLFMRGLGEAERDRLLIARSPALASKLSWTDPRAFGDPTPNPTRPISFLFEGLDPQRLPGEQLDGKLLLPVRPRNPGEFIRIYKVALRFRNPETDKASAWTVRFGRIGKPISFNGPSRMVDARGRLEVQLLGADPRLEYRADRLSLRLYAHRSSYGLNFAKGFLVVYAQLLLIAAVALACSTFMTAPVAIVCTLFVALLGNLLEVIRSFALALGERPTLLREIMQLPGASASHDHDHHAEGHHLEPHMEALKDALLRFCDWYPDFARFDMTPRLVDRIDIPLEVTLRAVGYGVVYAALFGLVGLLVFQFKQVDRA